MDFTCVGLSFLMIFAMLSVAIWFRIHCSRSHDTYMDQWCQNQKSHETGRRVFTMDLSGRTMDQKTVNKKWNSLRTCIKTELVKSRVARLREGQNHICSTRLCMACPRGGAEGGWGGGEGVITPCYTYRYHDSWNSDFKIRRSKFWSNRSKF